MTGEGMQILGLSCLVHICMNYGLRAGIDHWCDGSQFFAVRHNLVAVYDKHWVLRTYPKLAPRVYKEVSYTLTRVIPSFRAIK